MSSAEVGEVVEGAPSVFSPDMPDGCPPDTALLADGAVYRVVKNNPPASDDFLTYAEDGKFNTNRACDSHGISVFRERDDAEFYADKFQYLGDFIAKGILANQHGKIGDTPRYIDGARISHATWWPYQGLARHALFVVVPEG